MGLHRFFLDHQVLSEEEGRVFPLGLSEGDLRHARVLRLAPGEHVAVVDASGDYFECKVERFDGELSVSISSREGATAPAFRITLFQALAKGDKMETVVRHATEVGASAFAPFSSSRCVAKLDAAKAARRRERWEAVAKSAAMQAGRLSIPEVYPVRTFDEAACALSAFDAVAVFWEEADGVCTLKEALAPVRGVEAPDVAVVIGPEGGLSPDEAARLVSSNSGAQLVSMGPNILRAETAGVVGCALAAYELGGMGAAPAEAC